MLLITNNIMSKHKQPNKALFPIGEISITPEANAHFRAVEVLDMLAQHIYGSWGDCSPEEVASNNAALTKGKSIRSVFHHEHVTCMIETNPERSLSHISLSQES